jgi:hypothetical protein
MRRKLFTPGRPAPTYLEALEPRALFSTSGDLAATLSALGSRFSASPTRHLNPQIASISPAIQLLVRPASPINVLGLIVLSSGTQLVNNQTLSVGSITAVNGGYFQNGGPGTGTLVIDNTNGSTLAGSLSDCGGTLTTASSGCVLTLSGVTGSGTLNGSGATLVNGGASTILGSVSNLNGGAATITADGMIFSSSGIDGYFNLYGTTSQIQSWLANPIVGSGTLILNPSDASAAAPLDLSQQHTINITFPDTLPADFVAASIQMLPADYSGTLSLPSPPPTDASASGITVTNPGMNYASQPTFTFSGGGQPSNS